MSTIFLKVINMSITASWLILAVILIRMVLKKAPKWVMCLLWAFVAIRLICPFSFESVLSLVPSSETIPYDIELSSEPAINSGIPAVNSTINPIIAESFTPEVTSSANPLQVVIPIAEMVWIIGVIALLIYALISYIKLKKTVAASASIGDGIMTCDDVKAPFILGVFRPIIYVPSSMSGETLDHVIRHETAHLKRCDHWWKPLGFLLLSVYWFNPLSWIAYVLLCRDIEMACDERVIRNMDKDDVAAYSQALLDCSFSRRQIAACPLAFGEVGVKDRVKGVLNYKKPAFWIIIVAIIACIAVAIFLMTNPPTKQNEENGVDMEVEEGEVVYMGNMRTYSQTSDGTWKCEGHTYKYRLEITGRMHNAAKDSKLVYLSNIADMSFEQAAAPLFSSDSNDWFDPEDAVLVDLSTIDSIEVTSKVAYAGWTEDGEIYTDSFTPVPVLSSVRYLPVYVFDTKEDLDKFREKYKDSFSLDRGYEEVQSFNEATAGYDNSFFETHTIVLTYIISNAKELRYSIQEVNYEASNNEASVCLDILESNNAETTTDGNMGWFAMAEISDEELVDVKDYFAKIVKTEGITYPWKYWDSLSDAEEAVGFAFGLPEVVADSYSAEGFCTMNGDAGNVIEVFYRDDDYEVWVRKAKATEGLVDISEDDSEYGASSEVYEEGGATIVYYHKNQGDGLKALISYKGYNWSLIAPNGFWGDSCADFITGIIGEHITHDADKVVSIEVSTQMTDTKKDVVLDASQFKEVLDKIGSYEIMRTDEEMGNGWQYFFKIVSPGRESEERWILFMDDMVDIVFTDDNGEAVLHLTYKVDGYRPEDFMYLFE